MKVCPKCNSSYSDVTLNFCLADGVPLVPQEILDEYLSKQNSKSWHHAETLVDSRFPVGEARATAVNPSARTFELANTAAQNLGSAWAGLTPFVIGGMLLLLVAGGAWWFTKTEVGGKSVISDQTPSMPKHAVVPITAEQEAQVKKELTDFMASWAKTNSEKNSEAHLAHYANVLEVYYGESGKDKNHVLADRLRAYQLYDTIEIRVDNVKISPESTESAMILFDKSWTMRNDKKTSTGSVQQEIHVSRTNGRWLIDGEKDAKVYFINNRENSSGEVTNQPSNQPENTNSGSPGS